MECKFRLTLTVFILFLTSNIYAATTYWQGPDHGNWSDNANWSGNAPVAEDTAAFNNLVTTNDILVDVNSSVTNLDVNSSEDDDDSWVYIANGTTLTVTGGVSISSNGVSDRNFHIAADAGATATLQLGDSGTGITIDTGTKTLTNDYDDIMLSSGATGQLDIVLGGDVTITGEGSLSLDVNSIDDGADSYKLILDQCYTVDLNGTNTFDGGVQITQDNTNLTLRSSDCLGTGTLDIDGDAYVLPPVTIPVGRG